MSITEKVIPIKPVSALTGPDGEQDQTLYEVRKTIYPRAVTGWFANWRWALVWLTQLAFYGSPWLSWNGRQAVLFDLGARKFYIFGVVFWPQDFIYLAVLLIISAYSLFLFTTVAGRLWCGYACPQTVYTEIFLWIERKVEGSRVMHMKRDAAPMNADKLLRKTVKHGLWIAVALWTGFTFVGYFTPIQSLAQEVLRFSLGPWETFWLLFYGFATYGNAGWLREQVCKYMCPYARFQSVMFDRDTLVITYDTERGEPRGARSKKVNQHEAGVGDCVDCSICVQVCPTGIDIRKGLQYECIGCAACIDGCDQVMDKMGYARGLIRYASLNAVAEHLTWRTMLRRVLRPRVLIYAIVLWVIIIAAAISLYHRVPIKVDVIRDRGSMAREVEDERIENVYRLQIMNTDEKSHRFEIKVEGLDGARVVTDGKPLEIAPTTSRMMPVRLQIERSKAPPRGSNRIAFSIIVDKGEASQQAGAFTIREKSVFIMP